MTGRVFMTTRALESLLEYSTTLPTGTTEGKRWRRAVRPWFNRPSDEWHLGEFGTPYPEGHEYHGQIPIHWFEIVVTDAPRCWPRHVLVPLRAIPSRIGAPQ